MGVYRLSRKAASDIEDIYTYTIEQHGLAAARKYLDGLHSCFELLAEYPMLGRRADRIECQGSANTNRLLPELGRSSGVSPDRRAADRLPVLAATYCRPSTA